jgi:DNA-binding response OmpR family regulator
VTVLICDDDKDIANAIAIYMEHEGYETLVAHDGRQALDLLAKHGAQLVIMDVMMPVMDGIRATKEIRASSNIPILMLSAKSEDTDKILGLGFGADDYVTKPFNPLELIARVKSLLRRFTQLGGQTRAESASVFEIGGLCVDDERKTVTVDGAEARLTPLEYKILLLLIRNPGRVFSIDQIYEHVWGEEALGGGGTVTVHIRRIREKIEYNPKEPKYIKVVWGIGYKMEKADGPDRR